jgi:hypothetical protein
MRINNAVLLCAIATMAAGCGTTSFNTTWKNPEAKPVSLDGQKVIAMVISTQDSVRRPAEDTLAAQITAQGAHGVAAWTILPTADTQGDNEDKARAAFAKEGAVAVVTMEVVGQTRDSSNTAVRMSWSSSPHHRSFWGNYRWSWHTAWHPEPTRTNVWIETLVYSLDPDELLWAGRSRTMNPNNATNMFRDVGNQAAREMQRAGLLKGPAR